MQMRRRCRAAELWLPAQGLRTIISLRPNFRYRQESPLSFGVVFVPIEFDCPACDTLLRTPDRKAGQRVNCPACGEAIWVPDESPVDSTMAPAGAGQSSSEPWRQQLPSERSHDVHNIETGFPDTEATGGNDSALDCAHCGSPRSPEDLECRYCGVGFLEALAHSEVIPRDIADIFRRAWEMFSRNAGLCIFASLIDLLVTLMGAVVVLTPAVIMLFVAQKNPLFGSLAFFVLLGLGSVLVYASVTLGHAQFYFHLATGERPDVFSILHVAPHLRSMLIATSIYFSCVALGLVLFIVPGLVLAAMWGMYPFVLVHKSTGPIEALGEAWSLSSGNLTLVLPMALLSFVVLQLASTVPGAFLVVIPFTALVQTYLYLHLSHRRPPRHR